jgi:hypothetical protein
MKRMIKKKVDFVDIETTINAFIAYLNIGNSYYYSKYFYNNCCCN